MPALQVRDFPEDLYEKLKEVAAREHRSVAQQTIGPRGRVRPRWRPLGAARRGRRALPCVRGTGRRHVIPW